MVTFCPARTPRGFLGRVTHHDLTTVIVNWNTADLLDGTIENVLKYAATGRTNEIIVVDNDSADESMAMMAEKWPDIRVIQMGENAGFCRANNAAIRDSDSEYVLMINTDGRLAEDTLDTMLSHMEAHDDCAVVGPRLEYGDGSFQRWTGGEIPTVRSVANFSFGLDRFGARVPAFRGVYASRHDAGAPRSCGWVSSAVMLVRRAGFDDFGLLDDDVFLYMDDVDLCDRAIDAGWTVRYAAETTAVHYMSASSKRQEGAVSPEAMRSAIAWFGRRHTGWETALVRLILALGFAGRSLVYRLLTMLTDRDGSALAAAHWNMTKLALERPNG